MKKPDAGIVTLALVAVITIVGLVLLLTYDGKDDDTTRCIQIGSNACVPVNTTK